MCDDYNTNSHYLTYTFLFRKVGRMYFLNLGVNGLTVSLLQPYHTSHGMKNLAIHSLLRWKMIILPILTTSLNTFLFKRLGELAFRHWE